MGAQFERFFAEDDLWLGLGDASNRSARRLADGLMERGIELANPCHINQVFAVVPNRALVALRERFGFYDWEPASDDRTVVRLVCSWATPIAAVDAFLDAVARG
jgi:threonine aldolase